MSGSISVMNDRSFALMCGGAATAFIPAEPVVQTRSGSVAFRRSGTPGNGPWTVRGTGGGMSFERSVTPIPGGAHVRVVLRFKRDCDLVSATDTVLVRMKRPDYTWTPSLCPEAGQVIGDHSFRSPWVLLRKGGVTVGVAPDLDSLARQRYTPVGKSDWRITGEPPLDLPEQMPAFMDLQKERSRGRKIAVGFADFDVPKHVYFRLTGKPVRMRKGRELEIAWFLLAFESDSPAAALRPFLDFHWRTYAASRVGSTLPQKLPFAEYVAPALKSIEAIGEFREFTTAEGVPAAGFRTASGLGEHDIAGSYFRVPPRCVWFHAWFNSLRTAFGIRRYALASGDRLWLRRADAIKELALSAPEQAGLTPALYDYDRREWWCGVTRLGGGKDIFEVPAAAQTALWMLLWHRHLDADPRLLARARRIAKRILSIQDRDGSFPGYQRRDGTVFDLLRHSGMSGMSSFLLAELCETERTAGALDALRRSCDFYIREIIPSSRYHDFEAFFSCSEKPLDFYDSRTDQHAQNNLCLYWITESLLRAHRLTGERRYLEWGLYCLDQLSLYQQVWNPPFVSAYTFGGFGVMNTDGEWNDLREVLFSRVYFLAYELTGAPEYFQRGAAALRAGYALVSHPLHRDTNPLRYDTFAVGLTPENIAHCGWDGRAIRSGFDWGAGLIAASTALTGILYGDLFIDLDHRHAFGINGVVAGEPDVDGRRVSVEVTESTNRPRRLHVVFAGKGIRRAATARLAAGERRWVSWRLKDF